MTKKDFFILIIKLFGLYSIITSLFSVLPRNISFLLSQLDLFAIIWIAITIFVVIGLFVLLIFKSETLVRLLKLEKGFDSDYIDLGQLKTSDLVKFSTFIIGGLLIIDNIPSFLSQSIFAFQGEKSGYVMSPKDNLYWASSTIRIIVGYALLSNYSKISDLFNRKINN